jgi:hypothetical protein
LRAIRGGDDLQIAQEAVLLKGLGSEWTDILCLDYGKSGSAKYKDLIV